MTENKSRSRLGRPWRLFRRLAVFLAYDVLHAANLVNDGIASPVDQRADSQRRAPRRRRRFWHVMAAPIMAPLWAVWRLARLFGAMVQSLRLSALPLTIGRVISARCHEFLDNWGLLDDAIDGGSGPRRRLLGAVRFVVGFVMRIVPRLRHAAFVLLSEVLYHLGLISDSVDAQRVWTRNMTLSVLPALLGLAAAVGIGIRIASTPEAELVVRYAAVAQEAIDSQDYVHAALWLTRLAKTDPRQPVYRYGLAVAFDNQGQHARAWALMEELGPTTRPGYPPANLWLAKRLCEGPTATVGQLQAAWRHLSRVLRYYPNSDEAHQLLARVLVSLGQLADAEKHLQQSAANDPEMRLLLAAVYARQGKLDLAGREAHLADAGLSQQLESKQAQPLPLRLRLADAKVLAGDFAGAEKVLSQIELDEPAATQPRLSQLYLAWYDALGRAGGASPVERCTLLKRALDTVPWNLPSIKRLLDLTRQSPAEAAWASGLIEKLDWKAAPAEAHMLVGLDEWQAGHSDAARQHFEAAYRADPKDIRASNNLAWMLAHQDPPELARALELANQALAQAPGQPSLLDTRGRILFKLGRWPDALRDLESLAAVRPQTKQLHEMLADCYAKLGMVELADFQRRLASHTTAPANAQDAAKATDEP